MGDVVEARITLKSLKKVTHHLRLSNSKHQVIVAIRHQSNTFTVRYKERQKSLDN